MDQNSAKILENISKPEQRLLTGRMLVDIEDTLVIYLVWLEPTTLTQNGKTHVYILGKSNMADCTYFYQVLASY